MLGGAPPDQNHTSSVDNAGNFSAFFFDDRGFNGAPAVRLEASRIRNTMSGAHLEGEHRAPFQPPPPECYRLVIPEERDAESAARGEGVAS